MKKILESSYVVGMPTVTATILKAKSRYNNKDIIYLNLNRKMIPLNNNSPRRHPPKIIGTRNTM